MTKLQGKKTAEEKEEKDEELLAHIRVLLDAQMAKSDICLALGISSRKLYSMLKANSVSQTNKPGKDAPFGIFQWVIKNMVKKGKTRRTIFQRIRELGYRGTYTVLCQYCNEHFGSARQSGFPANADGLVFISRRDILKYIWSGKYINKEYIDLIYKKYPDVKELNYFVVYFRETMQKRDKDLLTDWIRWASLSKMDPIRTLGNGMLHDLEAIQNSVKYKENNAFLEGNVNRAKVKKRQMYGRAGVDLLRAKLQKGICYS